MSSSGISAYDALVKSAETPGETDAAVLEKAAQFLLSVQKSDNDEDFDLALNYNQRIWTVIQSYLIDNNALPEQIVANLISLSIFVDKQTFKAMADKSREKLDILITINREIAAGFRASPTSNREGG